MFKNTESATPLLDAQNSAAHPQIKVYAAVPVAFLFGILIGVAPVIAVVVQTTVGRAAESTTLMTDGNPYDIMRTPYDIVAAPKEVPVSYYRSASFNNSCLIPGLGIPLDSDKPKTFDACGFVIRSTDEVWNLRGDVDGAIEKYFHRNYINAGSWGKRAIGKKALRDAVLTEMRAFPDIRIHITDCVCHGNDLDGYKCAMPDVLEGTNTGPSAYGPATGRYARWSGLVQSVVKRSPTTGEWQYWAEWGVHDEWALLQQLGLDISRVPHPQWDDEPIHDCTPLVRFAPEPAASSASAPSFESKDAGAQPIYDSEDAAAQMKGAQE